MMEQKQIVMIHYASALLVNSSSSNSVDRIQIIDFEVGSIADMLYKFLHLHLH